MLAMPNLPRSPTPPPLLRTHSSLVQTLTSYLTCAVHTLLYTRSLYPQSTFLLTRKYNTPLQQSRHPAVCAWINASISHIEGLLLESRVHNIAFVVFSDQGEVMERWVFDIERMPIVGYSRRDLEFEYNGTVLDEDTIVQNLEEQFRAALRRVQYKGEQMGKLPERCTFTLAIELREGAEAPIGGMEKDQAWEVGNVSLQRPEGKDLGGERTNAIKLVESGEFVMEMWVEESKAKLDFEKREKRATVEDEEDIEA